MRDKNSYWKFEKTGIDNADVRGEKFDADAFRRDAEDAVSAATPPVRKGLMLGYESPEMLARRVAGQPKFDLDAPFYIDEAQKRFSSADEFSDWVLAVDGGAAESFERFRNLPDAKQRWQAEYMPAYVQKYGAKVMGVNTAERSTEHLDASRVRKMIDSIPDEEESLKLEAIGDADVEQLSDAHLEYAAERGQTWAADELVRRAEAENAAGIDSDDVFARLDFEGAKLPTPDAMARKGGSLSEEMRAVYDSLPAGLKRKYFADRNVKLDELAESLGYETEAELISALSDAAGRVADGYKVGNEKRRTKNEERKVGTPAKTWKSEPLDGVPESVATEIRRAENGLFDALTHKRDLEDFIYRDGLGYISCYYGEDGKIKDGKYSGGSGIAHLIGRRNNEGLDGFGIAMKIPRIVKLGKIGDEYGPENGKRVNIVYGDHTVVLSKFRFGEKENWVVTAWKNNDAGDAVNASSGYAVRNHGISTEQVASVPSQSENVSESQGKNLRSFEKLDFEDVNEDGFIPDARKRVEKSLADDAANAAKWVAMTPEERVAEACPDFTDKAIQLSRAMARKNAGHPLPAYGGLKLELVALKSGKFKIIEDGKKLKPIKVFRDETQAREFLDKWILAYADAGKITYYHAQKRGHFEGRNYADSLPLTNEDLLRVGDVVENWDDITYRKRKNADTITYQKTYPDGTVLYVEEILNGDAHGRPKRLASKSIYKRKAESSTDTAEASRYNVQNDESPQPFGYEQSENASESQGKNLHGEANEVFGAGGRAQMRSSLDPTPPDLTMPKDGRFDPRRVDSSPRRDYDASAAQAAFDGVWDALGNVKRGYSSAQIREVEAKMRDFTKKMDARMLELPELIEFAERIISGKVRAVKGFKGDYLGMYYGGEKKIELRRDLFKLVGDCRRYEVALDAAREVLKKKGFNEEVVESRRPDQIVQAVYENNLMPAYHAAFQKKINVEFGKAKRGGEPSAALMVAAHEIMHAVDDVRADGSRLGKHSGGTLGAIVGEIPKCITAVSKIRGWGEVLTPEIRKSISKCLKIL